MTGKEYNASFTASDLKDEIWKDVIGYEGFYQISNIGRIRTCTRVVHYQLLSGNVKPLTFVGRVKIPALNKMHKRLFTALYKDGTMKQKYIHQLVLENFVGPCPENMQACHNDGNAFNNRVENLRWDTCKNNHADKIKHGTTSLGEKNYAHKLTYNQVLNIRILNSYLSAKEISILYGVTKSLVLRILSFKHRVFA